MNEPESKIKNEGTGEKWVLYQDPLELARNDKMEALYNALHNPTPNSTHHFRVFRAYIGEKRIQRNNLRVIPITWRQFPAPAEETIELPNFGDAEISDYELWKFMMETTSDKNWEARCEKLKLSHNGKYPSNWLRVIMIGGVFRLLRLSGKVT